MYDLFCNLNTDVLIGFEQNYTVFEDVGSFEACFRVINPTEDQPLTLAVDLVVDTIEGTASAYRGVVFIMAQCENGHAYLVILWTSVNVDIHNFDVYKLKLILTLWVPTICALNLCNKWSRGNLITEIDYQ